MPVVASSLVLATLLTVIFGGLYASTVTFCVLLAFLPLESVTVRVTATVPDAEIGADVMSAPL